MVPRMNCGCRRVITDRPKRFRFKPGTLTAEWWWDIRDEYWKIRHVRVSGIRIHKTARWSVDLKYVDFGKGKIPEWAMFLVAEARPRNVERF